MKKKLFLLAIMSASLLVSRSALADTSAENYLNLQYGVIDYNEEGISESYSPDAIVGRYGRHLNANFSIEGRLGFGVKNDTHFLPEFGVSGLDVKMELDSIVGIYGAAHLNMTESSSLYALVGVSRVEARVSVPAYPAAKNNDSDTDLSYGAGANIGINNELAINIEYMQYLNESRYDLSAIGAGLTVRF